MNCCCGHSIGEHMELDGRCQPDMGSCTCVFYVPGDPEVYWLEDD